MFDNGLRIGLLVNDIIQDILKKAKVEDNELSMYLRNLDTEGMWDEMNEPIKTAVPVTSRMILDPSNVDPSRLEALSRGPGFYNISGSVVDLLKPLGPQIHAAVIQAANTAFQFASWKGKIKPVKKGVVGVWGALPPEYENLFIDGLNGRIESLRSTLGLGAVDEDFEFVVANYRSMDPDKVLLGVWSSDDHGVTIEQEAYRHAYPDVIQVSERMVDLEVMSWEKRMEDRLAAIQRENFTPIIEITLMTARQEEPPPPPDSPGGGSLAEKASKLGSWFKDKAKSLTSNKQTPATTPEQRAEVPVAPPVEAVTTAMPRTEIPRPDVFHSHLAFAEAVLNAGSPQYQAANAGLNNGLRGITIQAHDTTDVGLLFKYFYHNGKGEQKLIPEAALGIFVGRLKKGGMAFHHSFSVNMKGTPFLCSWQKMRLKDMEAVAADGLMTEPQRKQLLWWIYLTSAAGDSSILERFLHLDPNDDGVFGDYEPSAKTGALVRERPLPEVSQTEPNRFAEEGHLRQRVG
jgi:hypothetical protein